MAPHFPQSKNPRSSQWPSRSHMILFKFGCLPQFTFSSSPPNCVNPTSLLAVLQTYQACSCPRAFAQSFSSSWTILSLEICRSPYVIFFKFLFKNHLLKKASPECPVQNGNMLSTPCLSYLTVFSKHWPLPVLYYRMQLFVMCVVYCLSPQLGLKFHKDRYLCFVWLCLVACGILVLSSGIESGPLAVSVWNPNHWAAREFTIICY